MLARMGYLLIGHGRIDVEAGAGSYQEGMGVVAIPPNTTSQCFPDAGQTLKTT